MKNENLRLFTLLNNLFLNSGNDKFLFQESLENFKGLNINSYLTDWKNVKRVLVFTQQLVNGAQSEES